MVRRNEAAKVSLLGEAMPALAWSGVMVAALGVRLCTDVSKPTYAQRRK